ncbi:MAG: helix-turn-helix domain-containing protein [Pirellulaceae bacterium]|nr:helix-turn-helix domain-containing protein [Pirellulaceae bacterium]MDP6553298.1 helix-turn-helix domain-containing protein [Pirellulaceae bacterium]MDP6722601.1 helix-turn-helix domain-containing protein [Pirellulaceae bacterium]
MLDPKKWLTVVEAAHELGVSDSRVRQMLKAKPGTHEIGISGQKFGNTWAIAQSEVKRVKRLSRPVGNPNFVAKTA